MKSNRNVPDRGITTISIKGTDYLCLTDMARGQDAEQADLVIDNWLSGRNTVEFLGLWETLRNFGFNASAFDGNG